MNNKKTLILMTGFACNNNCIMCSLATIKQSNINRTTRQILLDIKKGKEEGFERIEFTGGEPAIRKDIFQLIKYANKLGFKEIGVGTNGNIFYYPHLCKKFVKSGLNKICFSLHGHLPKLHNAITRTPGSFEKAIKGIENMLKFPSVKTEVATVISRINYKYLREIFLIFDSLGITRCSILDLIPEGNANFFYNSLSVRLTDLSKTFLTLSKILPKKIYVNFFDFPLCLFSSSIRERNNICFIAAEARDKIGEQRGYEPTRIKKVKNIYIDKYKVRMSVCNDCNYNQSCGGVWKKYIELYGKDELEGLARINKVLKNV